MDQHTINLVNPHDIEDYLKKFCGDDPYREKLLIAALANIIKKSPSCMETLQNLPADAPAWLTRKWNSHTTWHKFTPRANPELVHAILFTLRWIQYAIDCEADWLKKTDDRGRPLKLLKLSSFDQLRNEGKEDRNRLQDQQRQKGRQKLHKEEEGKDYKTIMTFDDGFAFVRLMTARALDRESAFLEHCIGDNTYDHTLDNGSYYCYSLRTPDNLPCMTICIDQTNHSIYDMSGKRNQIPNSRYMPYIATFCSELQLDLSEILKMHTGYSKPDKDELNLYRGLDHLVNPIPDLEFKDRDIPISIDDDLVIGQLHISNIGCLKEFPRNLHVGGPVYLYGKNFPRNPPAGWVVKGPVHTGIQTFPSLEDFIQRYYPGHNIN